MKKENQLLNRISKALGLGQEVEVVASAPEVVEQAATAVAAALEVDTAQLQADLATATATLEALQGKFAELATQYEQAQTALSALQAEKDEMIAAATAAKADARKAQVITAIGTEKADALLVATEGLDDTAFNAVVSALVGSGEVEAKSALFNEVGVTAEVNAEQAVDEESKEMKILKAKYGKK